MIWRATCLVAGGVLGAALLVTAGAGADTRVRAERSVAIGRTNAGALRHATDVTKGAGPLRLLTKTVPRDLRWTTDDLAGALHHAAARVGAAHPGSVLSVGNLSAHAGGRIPYSVSHQNGLDADLAFYAIDAAGRPALPDDYVHYGAGLRGDGGRLRFCASRNWDLVRALLEDERIAVQWLFVSRPLRDALLAHGRATGAPAALLARAASLLHQPSDAPAHDDHLHLRIFCPRDDRALGCEDRGPRWPWAAAFLAAPPHPG